MTGNAELIESTLKQTIMCLCFDDFFMALEKKKMVRAYNMHCSLHLINVHIKKIQITILLFKNKQRHIIVCFSVLSISSAFTI
jgi:hypothetical protein